MKRFFLPIILAILALAGPARATSEVVVLQSSRLLPFEQARQGVERVLAVQPLARGQKRIQPGEVSYHVLSEEPDLSALKARIRREKPSLLIAIGATGLGLAREFTSIPVVYLLTPDPEPLIKGHPAATGIGMTVPPALQLEQFARALPAAGRLGMLYQPGRSEKMVAEARAGAAALGLELIAVPASGAGEVPALLAGLRTGIDAYWLLPDPLVLTPLVLDEILLFSFRNSIPVLSYTSRYLDAGAALAITCEPAAMGEIAGELARDILRGDAGGKRPPVLHPAGIITNQKVLKKMGISLNPETGARSGASP